MTDQATQDRAALLREGLRMLDELLDEDTPKPVPIDARLARAAE